MANRNMYNRSAIQEQMPATRLYQYSQNNSGGWFDDDLGREVWIEAENAYHADQIAQTVGIYFDGCEKQMDCPCCGDRWYRASEYNSCTRAEWEADPEPSAQVFWMV